jgi:hypothetical protein
VLIFFMRTKKFDTAVAISLLGSSTTTSFLNGSRA